MVSTNNGNLVELDKEVFVLVTGANRYVSKPQIAF